MALVSEVRAADEVTLVNTVHGADARTGATSGTLRVVDNREVVDHVDRIVRTALLALSTADTAV